ncbi:hypothetical protein [Priestia megaterium]|uniref:hypothetical protein n=1 Tax=Priestia megaterium TaxID=1404 RepID=UPI001A94DB26|nr:hypothetical protein [Priestia megaterium]QSX24491.1 hypothetical protein J0P05_33035 [Priestia megaterium]
MRTVYLESGDIYYECPRCETPIIDHTPDGPEQGEINFCNVCGEEFIIEIC